jgi:hypothetical protein
MFSFKKGDVKLSTLVNIRSINNNKTAVRVASEQVGFYEYLRNGGIVLEPKDRPLYAPHDFNRNGRLVEYELPLDHYFEADCPAPQVKECAVAWATGGGFPPGLVTLVTH